MKQMLVLSLISLILKSVSSKGEFYDYTKQICCDGILYDRPSDDFNFHCCNSTLLKEPINGSLNAPLCCNGRVFESSEEGSYCCGSQIYNYKNATCYYDQIIAFSPENQLQNKTQVCGADANNYQLYNYQESTCCSGTLYDIREDYHCCGSYQYDTRYSVCCGNEVIYIGESAANYDYCCGNQPYATEKQRCCTQYSNPDPNNPYLHVVTSWGLYPVNDQTRNDFTCCGVQLMKNDKSQVCCDSGPKESFGADSCCGEDLIYESNNELCVRGMKLTPGQISDCNGQSYNSSAYICSENQLYKLDEYIDICGVNGQTVIFYITEHACTKKGLIDKPAELRGKPHLYCTTWAEHNPTFFYKR